MIETTKLIYHNIERNLFNWNNGTHTLTVRYRGTREELEQLLKDILETELVRDA